MNPLDSAKNGWVDTTQTLDCLVRWVQSLLPVKVRGGKLPTGNRIKCPTLADEQTGGVSSPKQPKQYPNVSP